jgi:hypothetical protein
MQPRARTSQELSAPISLIEEYSYSDSNETPSSEESQSDAEFSEEQAEIAEIPAAQEEEKVIVAEDNSPEAQETVEKPIEIQPESVIEEDDKKETVLLAKEPDTVPTISAPIEPVIQPVPSLPDLPTKEPSDPVLPAKGEKTDSASQQPSSSRGGPSGISSRASRRLVPSRTNSRPGTGLLLAGQQPLLPDTVRTLKREPTRHWPLLPVNSTPRSSNAEDTLPPLRDSGLKITEESLTVSPDKPLSPLSSSLSSPGLQETHMRSLSRTLTNRTGLLPQFPLPPLVPIEESKPEHTSKQDADNKANRELFGQFSNVVVGSFLTILENEQEKKQHEEPQSAIKEEAKQEDEDNKAQVTNWLASKDVMTGLGKLFLPVIKAPVPGQQLPPIHRNSIFIPIVYGKESSSTLAGESSPIPRKSVLMPSSHRESFIMTESNSLLKVPAPVVRRASIVGRRPSILPPPEEAKLSLSKDFVLAPGQKSEAPVFIKPPKPAVPLTTQRVQDFLHYLDVVGFPMSTQAEVRAYPAKQEILPMHVIKMGKRLGMKVTPQKYNSAESDLLWIALLQLTAPPPPLNRLGLPQQVAMLPFKSHPGDEFFLLMSDFNRKLRARELDQLTKPEKVKSLVNESWLCLTTRLNIPYLYNFLTGERIALNKAQATPDNVDLSKDKRIAMLRAALEEQLFSP